jgi:hypothetical protein
VATLMNARVSGEVRPILLINEPLPHVEQHFGFGARRTAFRLGGRSLHFALDFAFTAAFGIVFATEVACAATVISAVAFALAHALARGILMYAIRLRIRSCLEAAGCLPIGTCFDALIHLRAGPAVPGAGI